MFVEKQEENIFLVGECLEPENIVDNVQSLVEEQYRLFDP